MRASGMSERLSAFVDGEIEGPERDGVIDALYQDPELRRAWERFHLIGDAMRGTGPVPGADAVARDVGAALSSEPAVRLKPRPKPRLKPRVRRSGLHPLSGLALAAAVAGIAVLGLHRLDGGGAQPPRVADASPPESAAAGSAAKPRASDAGISRYGAGPASAPGRPEARVTPVAERRAGAGASGLQWSGVAPDVEARLNAYLVSHNEYAGDGVRGVLPYVRIVGYQSFAENGR